MAGYDYTALEEAPADAAAQQADASASGAGAAASGVGASSGLGSAPSEAQFIASVLEGIGAPVNTDNLDDMATWIHHESSSWNMDWNPLNTSYDLGAPDGIPAPGYPNDGTAGYPTPEDGVKATIGALNWSNFTAIKNALQAGNENPEQFGKTVESTPWASSHYNWEDWGAGVSPSGTAATGTSASTTGIDTGGGSTTGLTVPGLPGFPGSGLIGSAVASALEGKGNPITSIADEIGMLFTPEPYVRAVEIYAGSLCMFACLVLLGLSIAEKPLVGLLGGASGAAAAGAALDTLGPVGAVAGAAVRGSAKRKTNREAASQRAAAQAEQSRQRARRAARDGGIDAFRPTERRTSSASRPHRGLWSDSAGRYSRMPTRAEHAAADRRSHAQGRARDRDRRVAARTGHDTSGETF